MNSDGVFIEGVHEAVDNYQLEVFQGLADLGLSQMAGSAGASGAVVVAPSRLATPVFNPGTIHKLQPTQIPRIATTAAPGLATDIASLIATLLLAQLLEAIGREDDVEEEERRKTEFCHSLAETVCARMKLRLSDEIKRKAIMTNDNAPRWERNRKSNKN